MSFVTSPHTGVLDKFLLASSLVQHVDAFTLPFLDYGAIKGFCQFRRVAVDLFRSFYLVFSLVGTCLGAALAHPMLGTFT